MTTGGTVWAWGSGDEGKLGIGEYFVGVHVPLPVQIHAHTRIQSDPENPYVDHGSRVAESSGMTSVSCGARHTVLVTESGRILACGRAEEGQLALKQPSQEEHPGVGRYAASPHLMRGRCSIPSDTNE